MRHHLAATAIAFILALAIAPAALAVPAGDPGDVVAPAAPAITAPAGDGWSTSADVSLAGTADAGTDIEVLDGTDPVATATTGDDGAWSAPLTGVADGEHSFTAIATDATGTASAPSDPRVVRVDTVVPATTITSGPEGATSATSADLAFEASEDGATFECRLDGPADATGDWSSCTSPWTLTGLDDRTYTLQVRATDPAGNTDAAPATRTFTVDTQAPAEPVVTTPTADGFSRSADVTLGGTADAGTSVEVRDGADAVATVTAGDDGTWSAPLTGVADGEHVYAAVATDAAGNVSTASESRTVRVDTQAPDTTIETGPGGTTAATSADVTFDADDHDATFECRLDGPGGTAGEWADCTSATTLTGLTDGSYTVLVRAIDAAGNADATPATRTFTVDTHAPAAPAITAPAEAALLATANVTLRGTGEAGAVVHVLDGTTAAGTATVGTDGAWALDLTGVTDGTHTYTATQSDLAGNVSAASGARQVRIDTAAPPAPVLVSPASDRLVATTTITLTGRAEAAGVLRVYDRITKVATTTVADTGAWSVQIAAVGDGTHRYTATVTDAAGNVSAASAVRVMTVDTQAPQTTIGAGPGAAITVDHATFAFSASDPDAHFQCRIDGPASTVGPWTTCLSPIAFGRLTDGTYTIRVRGIDAAGNTDPTPATRTFTVTLPKAPVTQPKPAPAAPVAPAPAPAPAAQPAAPAATKPATPAHAVAGATADRDGDGIRNDWLAAGIAVRGPKAATVTSIGTTVLRLALPAAPRGAKIRVYSRPAGGLFKRGATTTARTVTLRGLKPGTRYEIKLVAVDKAGHQSRASRTLRVTTRRHA